MSGRAEGHSVAVSIAPLDLVSLGAVRGAYGIKGWVRVAPLADGAALLVGRRWWLVNGSQATALDVEGVRRHAGSIVAKWTGCSTKEAADALKGQQVALPRSDFPAADDGEHYWLDLVGIRVVNRDGEELGQVEALGDNGAGQWLEVVDTGAHRSLIPLIEHYVDEIDTKERVIRVDWQRDW